MLTFAVFAFWAVLVNILNTISYGQHSSRKKKQINNYKNNNSIKHNNNNNTIHTSLVWYLLLRAFNSKWGRSGTAQNRIRVRRKSAAARPRAYFVVHVPSLCRRPTPPTPTTTAPLAAVHQFHRDRPRAGRARHHRATRSPHVALSRPPSRSSENRLVISVYPSPPFHVRRSPYPLGAVSPSDDTVTSGATYDTGRTGNTRARARHRVVRPKINICPRWNLRV